ncbi:MAG: hypothetical protein ACOX9C_00430 [Kiritimatiellia bacterium]|jgi:hypothetical protein
MKRKRLATPILIGLVAGGVWAAVGPLVSVGRMPYGDIALYGSWFLAKWLVLVSILLLVVFRGRVLLVPGLGLGIGAFFLVSLLGVSRADHLKQAQNAEAKRHCEALIPMLEAYKVEHGDYPDTIDPLLPDDRRSLPIYLRDGSFYFKGTNGYAFGWSDSPRFPLCSGVSNYQQNSGKWDCCADWGARE